jgi:protein ImuA
LAAQADQALFFVLRPLAAAQDASPSPLRLSLRPADGGVNIGFVKRRGPQRDEPLFLPLHTFIPRNGQLGRFAVLPTSLPIVSESRLEHRGLVEVY